MVNFKNPDFVSVFGIKTHHPKRNMITNHWHGFDAGFKVTGLWTAMVDYW